MLAYLVGHLGTLLEGFELPICLEHPAHEDVLSTFIRTDKTASALLAEPLNRAFERVLMPPFSQVSTSWFEPFAVPSIAPGM